MAVRLVLATAFANDRYRSARRVHRFSCGSRFAPTADRRRQLLLASSGMRFSMGTVLPWQGTLPILAIDYVIFVVVIVRRCCGAAYRFAPDAGRFVTKRLVQRR